MYVYSNRKANVCTLLFILYYKKCVLKTSGRLLLVYAATFPILKIVGTTLRKICVENKRGLLFSLLFIKLSLFSYFCNMKNVCSNQAVLLL